MDRRGLTDQILTQARKLGFVGAAVTSSEPFQRGARALSQWLAKDHHGEMDYMESPRAAPESLLGAARSVIVVAH